MQNCRVCIKFFYTLFKIPPPPGYNLLLTNPTSSLLSTIDIHFFRSRRSNESSLPNRHRSYWSMPIWSNTVSTKRQRLLYCGRIQEFFPIILRAIISLLPFLLCCIRIISSHNGQYFCQKKLQKFSYKFHIYFYSILVAMGWKYLVYEHDSYCILALINEFYDGFS